MNRPLIFDDIYKKYHAFNFPNTGFFSEYVYEPFAANVIIKELSTHNYYAYNTLDYIDEPTRENYNRFNHTDILIHAGNGKSQFFLDIDLKMPYSDKGIFVNDKTYQSFTKKINDINYTPLCYIATMIEYEKGRWHLYQCPFREIQPFIKDKFIDIKTFIQVADNYTIDGEVPKMCYCNFVGKDHFAELNKQFEGFLNIYEYNRNIKLSKQDTLGMLRESFDMVNRLYSKNP